MRKTILIGLCLLIAGGALAAERTVTITPVSGNPISIDQAGAEGVCRMGNLNAPGYDANGWIWGNESYKYLFDADQPLCSTCSTGFKVEAVHMFLHFTPQTVPATFQATVDFEETVWDETLQCFLPGPVICESAVSTITIDAPGLYDIALPLPVENCPCAYFGYRYALGLNFLTHFDFFPGIVTDNVPVGCTSYNDYGSGWEDLQDYGLPGELIMRADVVCCDNPVDDANDTWGGVKSLFR